ncbi:MAG: hypothetical protein JOY64_00545 [Alphaproteobacteria bacterium]|nr:hypothetical protein [Alphaproteobacteria bacterium]MBV8406092.1 hypothetical protein [Alphaproteobacteria bacterium]
MFGVNGHDGRIDYPLSRAEARFQLLRARNLRSYRFDVSATDTAVLDTLVPLAKAYSISLRPMLYPASQAATYRFVRRYAGDVQIWEIGNEQDSDRAGAQIRIAAMLASYRGVQQASSELHLDLKTSINMMACNSNDASGTCPRDPNGNLWFLDMAAKSGFAFNYVTFHYYPHYGDRGYWMDLYLTQMRTAATRYRTKVFLNETNCAEVFAGNIDGGSPRDRGCYDGLKDLLEQIKAGYSDIVQEVNLYELLDSRGSAEGVEQHFGLMYDLTRPKPTLDLVTGFAR